MITDIKKTSVIEKAMNYLDTLFQQYHEGSIFSLIMCSDLAGVHPLTLSFHGLPRSMIGTVRLPMLIQHTLSRVRNHAKGCKSSGELQTIL